MEACLLTELQQTTGLNITSAVYLMSSLEADTAYDVEVVDIECPKSIIDRLSVMTNLDLSKSSNFVLSILHSFI